MKWYRQGLHYIAVALSHTPTERKKPHLDGRPTELCNISSSSRGQCLCIGLFVCDKAVKDLFYFIFCVDDQTILLFHLTSSGLPQNNQTFTRLVIKRKILLFSSGKF